MFEQALETPVILRHEGSWWCMADEFATLRPITRRLERWAFPVRAFCGRSRDEDGKRRYSLWVELPAMRDDDVAGRVAQIGN